MSNGVLYIANSNYLDEAERSAESVRKQTDLPIGVVTDRSDTSSVFDKTITVDMPRWDWNVRIDQFDKTPFDKTLYLDTDTYVCGDVSGIFDLLKHFELAAAHAPIRNSRSIISEEPPSDSLPDAFPEFNCGVIGFKQSEPVSDMMDDWLEIFRSQREQSAKLHDQPAFRQAVLESEARIATLPPEYNCRLPFPGYVERTVKIIHGTANNYQEIADKINAREGPRTYNCEPVNDYWSVELGPKKTTVNLQSLRRTVKERGIRGVIDRAMHKILAR